MSVDCPALRGMCKDERCGSFKFSSAKHHPGCSERVLAITHMSYVQIAHHFFNWTLIDTTGFLNMFGFVLGPHPQGWIDCSHELILCFLDFRSLYGFSTKGLTDYRGSIAGWAEFHRFHQRPLGETLRTEKNYMNCSGDSVTGHRWDSNSISPAPSYACNMYVTLCNYFLDPLGAMCKHTFFWAFLLDILWRKWLVQEWNFEVVCFQTSPRLGLMRMSDHTGRFRLKMSDLLPFVEPWLVSTDVLGIMEVYKYPRQSSMFVYVSVISSGCF